MSHYYDAHPDAATDEKEITYAYQQHQLHLTTDAGVFLEIKSTLALICSFTHF